MSVAFMCDPLLVLGKATARGMPHGGRWRARFAATAAALLQTSRPRQPRPHAPPQREERHRFAREARADSAGQAERREVALATLLVLAGLLINTTVAEGRAGARGSLQRPRSQATRAVAPRKAATSRSAAPTASSE